MKMIFERVWRLTRAPFMRQSSVVNPYLIGLVGACLIVSAWVLFIWGRRGWPIGAFWWDELALAGAAEAVRTGMVPTVDFWAPFVFPLYQKLLSITLVGYSGSYVAECLLQGALVLILFLWMVWGSRPSPFIYIVVFLVVLTAVAPFNILSVTEAPPGSVSYACSYNRLGGAMIALALLFPGVMREKGLDGWRPVLWLSVLFVFAFLLKITVFQAVLGIVAFQALVNPRGGWLKLLIVSSLFSFSILILVFQAMGGHQGYFEALAHLSRVRMSNLSVDLLGRLNLLIFMHRFELAVYLLCGLLVLVGGGVSGGRELPNLFWYLFSCAVVCLYTITNYGDNGLMPAVAAMWSLLDLSGRSGGGQQLNRIAYLSGVLRSLAHWVFYLLVLAYIGLVFFWSYSLYKNSLNDDEVRIPVRVEKLSGNYSIPLEDWESRSDLTSIDLPINVSHAKVFAGYVKEFESVYLYVSEHWSSRATRLYVLDFPAYIFSLVGGYAVPLDSYAWMLYGHELNLDYYPKADKFLANVDVLVVSQCSLAEGNRKWLFPMYRTYIEKNFAINKSMRCWDVYVRKN